MSVVTCSNQKSFFLSLLSGKKSQCRNVLLGSVFFFSLNSYSLPVIPDKISIPAQLKHRSAKQIKVVFSSLEKQHNQKTANLWKLKYYKAMLLKNKDADSFCSIMKELAEAPAFPLKDLALINSYELCPYPDDLKFDPESFPEWLGLRLAKAFYKRRKVFENPKQTLKATIYLAENSVYKDLRISYLKHALSLAIEQKEEWETERLKQLLYKAAPRLRPNPLPKDYFLIAEDLRQNRNFKSAVDFYIKVLNSPEANFDEKNLSFKGLNRIYKIQKDNKRKIINSRQWSDWLLKENTEQSLEEYYNRQLELARQQWNFDENEKAIQSLTNIIQDQKSVSVREKALYLRGLVYIQESKPELSLIDWDKAIKQLKKKRDKSGLLEKILWKKAWLLRNQNNYRKAFNNFKFLEKITKNPYTKSKALFWKGKTLHDLGQKTLAKKSFRKLIEKDYFGYYGLLAHKMLDKKPIFPSREESSGPFHFSKDVKAENLIHWLVLCEESDLLSPFLDTQKDKFLSQKKQTERDWLKMILLWTKAERYLEIFQSLEKMDDNIKNSFLKKYVHFLFPLGFSEEVDRAVEKWSVPKAFVFAVIRQESAFNVRARSLADAFGLMQLIPSTARQTAKRFKIPYRGFRDLYRPSKNILLGTAHMKKLLKHYNSNFLFSIAAYNAGETPVKRWREEMKGFSDLEFIENIPYEETRTYVRLVIRNYIFYHNKLNGTEPWFPEELIQW